MSSINRVRRASWSAMIVWVALFQSTTPSWRPSRQTVSTDRGDAHFVGQIREHLAADLFGVFQPVGLSVEGMRQGGDLGACFDTRQAHTGTQAVDEARRFSPDVVVLDLGLPELDGLEVCRRIRTFSDCYILTLTARGSEDDKISGLTLRADDYITKPFSIRELVTRVHAVLCRPRTSTTPPQVTTPLIVGDLILDLVAHQARVGETTMELTRTEFELLVALALPCVRAVSSTS